MHFAFSQFLLLVLNCYLSIGQIGTTPSPRLTVTVENLEDFIKEEVTRQIKEFTDDAIKKAVTKKVQEVNKLIMQEATGQIRQANVELIKQEVTKQIKDSNNQLIKEEVTKQVTEKANTHLSNGARQLGRLADGVQQLVNGQNRRGNI